MYGLCMRYKFILIIYKWHSKLSGLFLSLNNYIHWPRDYTKYTVSWTTFQRGLRYHLKSPAVCCRIPVIIKRNASMLTTRMGVALNALSSVLQNISIFLSKLNFESLVRSAMNIKPNITLMFVAMETLRHMESWKNLND